MKKTILFIVLVATMGCGNLQAQDTIWQKTAPLSNYFSNRWIDTTERYTTDIGGYALSHCSARQFFTQDTLQIYGIAAMMMNPDSFFFVPSSYYPNLQALLNASYPNDPTFNNCEESLMLYQYNESDTILMHQLGEALPVHLLHTPVSCYMMTNRPPVSNWDPYPKPIYERYFSSPQTVYDTFYVGVTDYEWDYVKPSCEPRNLRSPFMCVYICYPDQRDLDEVMAVHLQTDCEGTCIWRFYRDYIHSIPFLFPIIAPPDTTVNPGDTIVDPIDTIVSGDIIVRPGNTVVIAPGDIIVIGGDTIVNTGDTLTVTLGDTVVISGHPIVFHPGDTLVVNSGDTIFFGPNSTIFFSPGSTIAILGGTGGDNPGGDDPVVGLRQADMVYRYTAVSPNPATGSATVTSSFGLTQIEAFDEQGRLVQTLPATGLKATLDVSSWPRGTYLLRIHTPLGTATKKLLVQ